MERDCKAGRIEVRLFAYFRDGRGKVLYVNSPTVGMAFEELGIQAKDVSIMLVNGRDCGIAASLRAGDALSLFPLVGGG